MTLAYNAQGAGEVSGTWDASGWAFNTWKKFEVEYKGGGCKLNVDGSAEINLVGFAFAADPVADVHWGMKNDGTCQLDGNIAGP